MREWGRSSLSWRDPSFSARSVSLSSFTRHERGWVTVAVTARGRPGAPPALAPEAAVIEAGKECLTLTPGADVA
jgi:hypothetical protein